MMKKLLLILILPFLSNGQSLERGSLSNRSERPRTATNFSDHNSRDQGRLSAIATPVAELRFDRLVDISHDEYELSEKNDYTLNENGNLISHVNYTWASTINSFMSDQKTATFEPYEKVLLAYNEDETLDILSFFNWDIFANDFVLNAQKEYSYDENGNMIASFFNTWDLDNEVFVSFSKELITNDDSGNITISENYNWSTANNIYTRFSKDEYTYDENGNQIVYLYSTWNIESGEFEPVSKEAYTSDENGNLTVSKHYRWDAAAGNFTLNFKNEYTYDENGNLTLYLYSYVDTASSNFVESHKEESTHDENGNLTLLIIYNSDATSGALVATSKKEYTFDTNGHIESYLYSNYDTGLADFIPAFNMDYETVVDTDSSLKRMGTISKYNTISEQWDAFEGEALQSFLYYTKLSSLSTAGIEQAHFSVYPNPAKESLFINSTTIERATIYTILGKKVLEIRGQNKLDISPLSKGVYFINVSDGKKASTKKFIKN